MLEELIQNKVYYKIFDKTHSDLTHKYTIRNSEDLAEIDQVKKNKEKILANFSVNKILLLNQVHGNNIISDDDFTFDTMPQGDGSVTTKKNIILAIRTADCVPILLTNDDGNVIGAAHCGWRSAKLDIIEKLANNMRQKGGNKLHAIIGPSIAQASYEISSDFYQSFINESESHEQFFINSNKADHYMFDLPAFIKFKLEKENINIIKHIKEDTYIMKDKYPSYRRSTHTGEIYEQNILSTIMIR